MKNLFSSFLMDETAASFVEYAVLVGVLAIGGITMWVNFGKTITTSTTNEGKNLTAQTNNVGIY